MTGDATPSPSAAPNPLQIAAAETNSEPVASGLAARMSAWTRVLIIAMGALLVSEAYAMGREHLRGATAAYWVGQALILLPTAWTNLSRGADARSRVSTLVATAAAQSFLVWCYSPDQFRYPDELQHVLTAQNILNSHHLFGYNPYLSVSPGFPGLEIITTAIVQVTGLSLFHAGVIVVSLTHALVPVAVFLLFRDLTGSDRTAGIAAFVYSLAPHYSYFDTLFIYGAPAITFMVLVLNAAMSNARRNTNPLWMVVAFTPLVVTHHVSAVATIGILLAFAIVVGLSGATRRAVYLVVITVLMLDDLIGWAELHAASVFTYLLQPIESSFSGAFARSKGQEAVSVASPIPAWESPMGKLGAVVMLALVLGGIVLILRGRAGRLVKLFALLGLAYPVILGVRLLSSDGPELASRALSYAMLLVAFPVAIALERIVAARRALVRGAVATGAVLVLLVAAIVTGLPAAWERIPGRFIVASLESGVDQRVTAVGKWAAASWKGGQTVACDPSVCSFFAGYVGAVPFTGASSLYYKTTVAGLNRGLRAAAVDYIETDERWTQQLPATGAYFIPDVRDGEHTRPLAQSLLTKFDEDPLLDRVYDDGDIQVYFAGRTF